MKKKLTKIIKKMKMKIKWMTDKMKINKKCNGIILKIKINIKKENRNKKTMIHWIKKAMKINQL